MGTHGQLGTTRYNRDLLSDPFTIVPNDIRQARELSFGARCALQTLIWFDWHLGHNPGVQAVAEDLGCSRREANRFLRELDQAGWLDRSQHSPGATSTLAFPSPRRRLPLCAPDVSHRVRQIRPIQCATSVAPLKTPSLELEKESATSVALGENPGENPYPGRTHDVVVAAFEARRRYKTALAQDFYTLIMAGAAGHRPTPDPQEALHATTSDAG